MPEVIVWGLILQERQILLLEKNKEWTLIGGHVENNESLKQALVREIDEEVGLIAKPDALKFQLFIDGNREAIHRLHIFFTVSNWLGKPYNQEPAKHQQVRWHALDNLPANLGRLAHQAILSLTTHQAYLEIGW